MSFIFMNWYNYTRRIAYDKEKTEKNNTDQLAYYFSLIFRAVFAKINISYYHHLFYISFYIRCVFDFSALY